MAATIKFIIFDCPDCARKIEMEIAPGTTKKELAEQCAQRPEVTATAKQIYVTNCIVDGKYQSDQYIFTGKERKVSFTEPLAGG